MTIRKLVELDGEYGGWLEVDLVKLKRVAVEFKQWLLTVDPANDPFNFLKWDLPLVEAALNGTMSLPFKGAYPHSRELGEGWLPPDYRSISAPSYNTIRGALMESPKVIMKDGRYFAWADFEEPPIDEPRES